MAMPGERESFREERRQPGTIESFLSMLAGTDESLLAVLGNMAEGAQEEDDLDMFGGGIVDFLPEEVQFDDPPVKALIHECAAIWEACQQESQRRRKVRKRATAEIRKLQDYSGQQQHEANSLREHLTNAKESLLRRMQGEAAGEREMRAKIRQEQRHNARLRAALTDGVRSLEARELELDAAIGEQDATQASLMRDLQRAADVQAQLQAELESSKVATSLARQRDAELRATLAEEQRAAEDVRARLRTELWAVRERRNAFDLTAAACAWGSGDALQVAEAEAAEEDEGVCPSGDEMVDAPRAARLERRCWRQRRRIEALRDHLTLEEAATMDFEAHLDQLDAVGAGTMGSQAVPSAPSRGAVVQYPGGAPRWTTPAAQEREASRWVESMGTDPAALATEAQVLQQEFHRLAGPDARRAAEAERAATEALRRELDELAHLQDRLQSEEEAAESQESALAEANMVVATLRREVEAEREELRLREMSAEEQRRALRAQVDEQRALLEEQRAIAKEMLEERRRPRSQRGKQQPLALIAASERRNPRADRSPRAQQALPAPPSPLPPVPPPPLAQRDIGAGVGSPVDSGASSVASSREQQRLRRAAPGWEDAPCPPDLEVRSVDSV